MNEDMRSKFEAWATAVDYRDFSVEELAFKCFQAGAASVQGREPVAWLDPWTKSSVTMDYDAYGVRGIPLYAAPVQQGEQANDESLAHELLDRAHLAQDSFNNYLVDHPSAHLIKDKIDAAATALAAVYQAAGEVHFSELPQSEQCPSASFTKASWDAFEYWMERDIGNENVTDSLKDAWAALTPLPKEPT